jgi:hypothetical protein
MSARAEPPTARGQRAVNHDRTGASLTGCRRYDARYEIRRMFDGGAVSYSATFRVLGGY